MRTLLSLCLALAVLLTGCDSARRTSAVRQDASPSGAVQAVLAAVAEGDEGPELLEADRLKFCLSSLYGLSDGQWEEASVAVLSGARGFEVAVIRLAGPEEAALAEVLLEQYRQARQGDFAGYEPEQAALVENGRVCRPAESWAALLICQSPEAAEAALAAYFSGGEPEPASSAAPESIPSAPEETPAPSGAPRIPYVAPNIDDMTIYDTSAILSAWAARDGSGLSRYDLAIYQQAVQVLRSLVHSGMGEYEIERAVYAWLVSHVSYDYDHYSAFVQVSPDSFTPYNPLVEGKGVCLGFASAFQLLMDMAGVECITVVGASFQSREDHAWNMVRLDGAWYCVDATWDAGQPEEAWNYFNVTSNWMAETDHQWNYAAVPEATATDGGRPGP